MRKFLFMMLIASIALSGCSSDNDDSRNIQLEQTSWSGTMIRTVLENSGEYKVSISFNTAETGFFDILYITDNEEEEKEEPTRSGFNYSIDGKVLHIEGNTVLSGYWIISKYDEKNLVLEQGADIRTDVLTLTRKN